MRGIKVKDVVVNGKIYPVLMEIEGTDGHPMIILESGDRPMFMYEHLMNKL